MECVSCTLMVDARYVKMVAVGARFDLEVASWLLSPRLDLDRLRLLMFDTSLGGRRPNVKVYALGAELIRRSGGFPPSCR
jgi:hypothetical protein